MVKIIETIGFRNLYIDEVNDGVYGSDLGEPTEEELRKIEEFQKEYERQKRKYRDKKMFGRVLYEEGYKTGAKNRAEEKVKKSKK